ncbi:M28 family peptidase [Microcoleus sp. FACHB-68]|uniref:M28 family peptidase n=1 Tax=Microcoleus sp. FACHB-68 TaxID=2692826 RepID=UPI00168A0E8A|nr:M28 family peptidase [Microcoleus sp. FACHB-68]MBD1939008.1 M20/M25/M40 family metallo-hydrolase [Microcoleus sp. FACHB-68]
MRKRIWLGLLMILAVATVTGWNWYSQQMQSAPPAEVTAAGESRSWGQNGNDTIANITSKAAAESPVNAPAVPEEQLLSHIKALDFERYTQYDRQRVRDYISQSLTAWGWTPQLQEFDAGINLWAQRAGTDKDAGAILVAAHYDTVPGSPGADDNATGVATVLEVARLLGARKTPRALWVAFFDEEELGLRGSLAFNAGNLPLIDLRGVIVMDMIGFACHTSGCQQYPKGLPIAPPGDKGDFLAVVGDTEHLPLLKTFEKSANPHVPPVVTLPVPLKGMMIPDVLRSDHAPFWYSGIGAVLVTDTANLRTPHYHQASDQLATLDRDFFTGSAQLVVNATTGLLESTESLASAPAAGSSN